MKIAAPGRTSHRPLICCGAGVDWVLRSPRSERTRADRVPSRGGEKGFGDGSYFLPFKLCLRTSRHKV
jgi:hypothetical protein